MPMPELEDEDEYEVEEVRDEKKIQGATHFLIKWKGWPSEYNQWVPQENMANATGAIDAYRKRRNKEKSQIPEKQQQNPTKTRPNRKGLSTRKKSKRQLQ